MDVQPSAPLVRVAPSRKRPCEEFARECTWQPSFFSFETRSVMRNRQARQQQYSAQKKADKEEAKGMA